MRAVISVANVAARSGKTTVAVNLAAEISKRGIRTLLIDADPQARATPFFIKPDQVRPHALGHPTPHNGA
jgi:chromosome partitioning protein